MYECGDDLKGTMSYQLVSPTLVVGPKEFSCLFMWGPAYMRGLFRVLASVTRCGSYVSRIFGSRELEFDKACITQGLNVILPCELYGVAFDVYDNRERDRFHPIEYQE